MGFGINNKQIAVLESRFQFYENLSKEMLYKLERAVDKITESNHTVSIILERHENRLDNATQTNDLTIKMIDEVQKSVNKKISIVEKKIEDVSRIKSMIVGVGIASAILATSISTLASGWWSPSELGYKIQNQYVPHKDSKSK
jgi:hypothetical protein